MDNQFEELLGRMDEADEQASTEVEEKSASNMTDAEYRDFIKKRTRQSMGGEIPDKIIDSAMEEARKSSEWEKLEADRKNLRKAQGITGNIIGQTARGEDEIVKQLGNLSLRYVEEAIDKYIAKHASSEE